MDNTILNKPIQYLKMVGPRRAHLLEKLNIFCLGDLIYHFPREYEDRTKAQPAVRFPHDSTAIIKGTVVGTEVLQPRKNLRITKVGIHDGTGVFYAVWFNQVYIKKQLRPGTSLIVTGKMDKSFGAPQVKVADYDILSEKGELLNSNRVVPVYPLTDKLGQRALRQIIYAALEKYLDEITEFLPHYILEKYNLPEIKSALKTIHFPENINEVQSARKRFIFEEFFLLQLALAIKRSKNTIEKKKHKYTLEHGLADRLTQHLPFSLTEAQTRVWQEISSNMKSAYPMNRLLQGDVGSGKTVICIFALLLAAESGFQGALMAPTEILAEQHFISLQKYMDELGVKVGLVSGSMAAVEKNKVLDKIAAGELQIVVGTHAIIQKTIKFKNLSLVVVDEQHRFGVRQRATLQHKASMPDVLVMTATPIPRTLAMTTYGDLDISVIDEMPPGRRKVKTYAVKPSAMKKVYELMKQQIESGNKVYVVCALVEESEKVDVRPAVDTYEFLRNKVFPQYRVGLLHGRMGAGEKEEAMSAFKYGKTNILVATSVIEVGVDVPDATVMVVLDAHRFGLAQLHQLRGRVGRGASQSFCILVSEPVNDEAKERLRAMTITNDGFRLAEMDLQIRGPGEFFGTRQSGLPALRIADMARDIKVLGIARDEAIQLITGDPGFNENENKMLFAEMKRRLSKEGNFIDVS